jgi:hypothetical protein
VYRHAGNDEPGGQGVGHGRLAHAPVPGTDDRGFDQWAVYRHPDGTVVYVAQAKRSLVGQGTPLTALPLMAEQLAGLAADERFHLL